MIKKNYKRPAIKTLHLTEESSILADSQTVPVLRISDDEDDEIKSGYVDAKSNNVGSLWDE